MMKELRNVLTVRTTNKTSLKVKRPRKTKSKHKKKGKVILQSNQTSDQLSKDVPDGNITKQCTTILSDMAEDIEDTNSGLLYDTKNEALCDIKDNNPLASTTCDIKRNVSCDATLEDNFHSTSSNEEPSLGLALDHTNPVMMRHIAAMAANMALKQSAGSNKREEVFGSEQ